MFCSKCGITVEDGSKFCPNCGNVIAEAPSAPEPAPEPAPAGAENYGYGAGANTYGAYGYAPAPVKKSKTGLIVGICIGAAVLIATALILIFTLGGKGGRGELIGTWIDQYGYANEFKTDGTIVCSLPGYEGDDYTMTGEYKLEGDKLTVTLDGSVTVYEKSEKAKEGSSDGGNYWYIEGDTFYINGKPATRSK